MEVTGNKQEEKETEKVEESLENKDFSEVLETKKNRVKNNEGQADDKKATGRSQHIEEKKEERINNNCELPTTYRSGGFMRIARDY